ncbi:hypothetical protein BP5796_11713 [Coleophoma crateriformis]|uniref:Xylanolytic transcriptional activator regulatory domain-containing protein n=1 Tax=Coleophoma crateriformis TaxID=565419 RepID=A0A3D8QEE9_9HELO|nr:hypothetical protein BP5796_11713 [Coleophoma crateriformis]
MNGFHDFGTFSPTEYNESESANGSALALDFGWDIFQFQSSSNIHETPLRSAESLLVSKEVSFSASEIPGAASSVVSPAQSFNNHSIPPGLSSLPVVNLFDEHPQYSISYLGPSSDMDPFLRQFYVYSESRCFRSSLRSIHELGITSQSGISPSIFVEMPRRVTNTMADLLIPKPDNSLLEEFQPYCNKMLSLFQKFICPYYPVYSAPDATSSPSFLKASIYGLALPWRSNDPTLPWAQFDTVSVTRLNAPSLSHLWKYTWQCLTRDLHAPSLATLQTCLMLMEREKSKTFITDSHFDWNLVTTAVSLAYTLGLHINASSLKLSRQERSQRYMLWWLVFIQEKWTVATKGRPSIIKDDDFSVPRPSSEKTDDGELMTPFCSKLLRLTFILDEILQSFMTVKKAALISINRSQTITCAASLTDKLQSFHDLLQQSSRNIEIGIHEALQSIGVLRVSWIFCNILVHRTLIQATLHTPDFHQTFNAAVGYISVIEKELQQLGILDMESFWFSWSQAQFNAISEFFVLLCVVAPSESQMQFVRAAASMHRHWLWLRSKSFGVSRMSMVRLDSLLAAIDDGKMETVLTRGI